MVQALTSTGSSKTKDIAPYIPVIDKSKREDGPREIGRLIFGLEFEVCS